MKLARYDIFPAAVPQLPPVLAAEADIYYERLKARADEHSMAVFDAEPSLRCILGMSDFVARTLIQFPRECAALLEAGALEDGGMLLDHQEAVQEYIVPGLTDQELKKRLRILRRTRMVPLAWRDLLGRAPIEESFVALSNLAEQIVMRLIEVVRASMTAGFGDALTREGRPMPLLVLGMGKLGGGELNFSSDLDLICCYPYDGDTKGGSRSISHQEFFTRLVQRFANLLSDNTADGQCYRIDLRLRPFGDAGSLVSSFDALAIYYETQGRTWERYALVKAKLLGDFNVWQPFGDELIDMLRPFVYRRYIDFSAIESLRKLKHIIASEVRRRQLGNNFKLGSGGIREVEFIAQVFELMRGGRLVELQERSLRRTLYFLEQLKLLPAEVCRRLDEDYVYLRRLENCLQELADQQTQTLPDRERDQLRLTLAMNKSSYAELTEELARVMEEVHEEFRLVIHDEDEEKAADSTGQEDMELWESTRDPSLLAASLQPLLKDESEAPALAENILTLQRTLSHLPVGPIGRDTLRRLMPKVIRRTAQCDYAADLFAKAANLVEQVALRTTYLQLLDENDQALTRLISLLQENAFAAALISAHPILLDELIVPQYLKAPPRPEEYLAALRENLMRVEPDDLEGQMEALRLFKQINVLRIAMSDRSENLPLMKISDCLTWLAEALIRQMLVLAWQQTEQRFGCPPGRSAQNPGLAVIGYGKLGGIELGYKSDLDMVYIREVNDGMTVGARSVPCALFYQKLVQRLLHLSVTRMSGGVLYELDMRLRPDGDSGMLVADLDGFEAYQKNRAWTWEHQALVRARPIAGSKNVIDRFNQIRAEVLRTPRDPQKLRDEVLAMRDKMRRHLDRSTDVLFDLKQGRGAMVDVEFISQYLLLRYAPQFESMVLWSDNVRILDECDRLNILSSHDVQTLKEAYLAIRGYYHRVSLANLPRIVAYEDRPPECDAVAAIWEVIFNGPC